MSNILRRYYQGITSQIRAEVDLINSLFDHSVTKGTGNEIILRDFIQRFIPKRFSVGSGIVIDRFGNQSRQCDIIVYDALQYPSILSISSVHLFPIELVYATIEVKTSLAAKSIKEAISNIQSVRSLNLIQTEFGDYEMQKDSFSVGIRRPTPPIGFVFSYNTDVISDDTFRNWLAPKQDSDPRTYPSIICSLDFGIVGFQSSISSQPAIGSSILHEPEPNAVARCLTFPLSRPLEETGEVHSTDQVQYLKLSGLPGEGEKFFFDGITYPVKKVGDDYMAIDQARVLLSFILIMNDILSKKKLNPNINFVEAYLGNIDRFHFIV